MTDCEVTRLLTDSTTAVSSSNGNGGSSVDHHPVTVTGVEYRSTKDGGNGGSGHGTSFHQLTGPVIFTTGGFGGDTHGLLARYRSDLDGMPSTNDPRPAPMICLPPSVPDWSIWTASRFTQRVSSIRPVHRCPSNS